MADRLEQPRYLLLGEVLRPHGVRGELRMRILTDFPERIKKLKTVYVGRSVRDKKLKQFTVGGMRMHKGYGLLTLDEIKDRDDADRLRKLFVMVPIEDAVPLEDGEYYVFELIGLTVLSDEGETLGTLDNVISTGANDVYVVRGEAYGEVLLPDIPEVVLNIDFDAGTMTVHLMDGLLPD